MHVAAKLWRILGISRFVMKEMQAEKVNLKPNFKSLNNINQELLSMQFSNTSLVWDNPTLARELQFRTYRSLFCIIFTIVKWNPDTAMHWLLFIKTLILLYRKKTDDLYVNMEHFAPLLDLFEYRRYHKIYDPTNKRVPLTRKDELDGLILEQVVCLRTKL